MSQADFTYNNLCFDIIAHGDRKDDRTGTGTISSFGHQMRFNLQDEFPILTTKSVHFKSVVGELLWFLRGDTKIKFLQDHKIKIWDGWATDSGDIGAMYGAQWRDAHATLMDDGVGYDQIQILIYGLINRPNSRRHIVNSWDLLSLPNEDESPQDNVHSGRMALAPCHYSFQCYVSQGKLSMLVNQRSADVFLGVPFNIASYALLTHMLAQVCNLEVGELIWSGADVHIYKNHIEQVKTQMDRFKNGEEFEAPTLVLNKDITDIDDFTFDDIQLINYRNAGKLTGEVAI